MNLTQDSISSAKLLRKFPAGQKSGKFGNMAGKIWE